MEKVTLKVFRGTPEEGEISTYEIPTFPGMVVLDAIHYIQQNLEPSLACRWNCKAAKCGSCSAEVNGHPKLMCKSSIEEYPSGEITVTPLKTFPLVKDLVTDVSWNYRVSSRIPPLVPKPDAAGKPFNMQQIDVERVQEFRKCIECFLCQDVCHILREHDRTDAFYGPRQMVKLASLDMHPMDNLDRKESIKNDGGVGYCNITKCCTEVCPEHIHITDNAIIPLKERIADEYYDPIQGLLRKIGILKRTTKQPFDSVPNEQTTVHRPK